MHNETAFTEERAADRMSRSFLASLILSLLIGILLLGALVYFAGPWDVLANTRVLDLLIDVGLIQYHGDNAGLIEGVPDPQYYLKSQDTINWTLVLLAIGIFFFFWFIKRLV
jgi:hypothetical protein